MGVCECVRGGRCELQDGERLDAQRYQTCVDKLADGRFQPGNWRRAADTRAAGEGEGEGEVRDTAVHCLCGERSATPLGRAVHWAVRGFDGKKHGLPPDERERVGVAWLLLDEETGRVLRAGCKRLPATGERGERLLDEERGRSGPRGGKGSTTGATGVGAARGVDRLARVEGEVRETRQRAHHCRSPRRETTHYGRWIRGVPPQA